VRKQTAKWRQKGFLTASLLRKVAMVMIVTHWTCSLGMASYRGLVPGRLGHLMQPGRTVVCAASAGADGDAGMSSVALSGRLSNNQSFANS
jgi:hypothetical protein